MATAAVMFGASDKNPTLLPSLCLYLILFAFFILLNSMAQTSTPRLKGVSDSVLATFATRGRPAVVAEPPSLQAGSKLFEGDFIRAVGELIETAFPVVKVETVDAEQQLEARVPAGELFDDGSIDPKPAHGALLARIALLLRERPPGMRNDVEVLMPGLDARPLGPLAEPLAIARAGSIAARLREQGAPAGSVAVGLARATDGWVRFVFHVRPADEGRLPFAEQAVR